MAINAILPAQVLANGASDGDLLTVQADGSVAFEAPAGGGGIGGSTGSTDNAILRADGTGGSTLQSSGVTIDDSNNLTASKVSAANFVLTDWGWFSRGTKAIMTLDTNPDQMRMNNKPIVGLTELAFGANGTLLSREADDHIQQRRGTNPQTISVANTYTSTTSYERLDIGWNANVCTIQTTAGSAGGTKRGLQIGGASIDELGFFGATPVDQPATVADPSGGSTVDTEARAAIAAVIDRLQELGLIA